MLRAKLRLSESLNQLFFGFAETRVCSGHEGENKCQIKPVHALVLMAGLGSTSDAIFVRSSCGL